MIVLRKFIIFLMFSAFLVGCTTPLIDIDVKHSSGGGPGSGGAGCPAFAAARGWCVPSQGASIPLSGKMLEDVKQITVDVYKVETADGITRELYSPPFEIPVGGTAPTNKNDNVRISFSNAQIEKVP